MKDDIGREPKAQSIGLVQKHLFRKRYGNQSRLTLIFSTMLDHEVLFLWAKLLHLNDKMDSKINLKKL